MSAETQSEDICQLIQTKLTSLNDPGCEVILIGHSMGGALGVHAALKEKIPNLVGIVVIDVVEGMLNQG